MSLDNDQAHLFPDIAQEAGTQVYVLHVIATLPDGTDPEDVHPQDRVVPGRYEVLVPMDVPLEHVANCALDGFHSTVPIKVLDGFSFQVIDVDTGEELECDPDLEDHELASRCGPVDKLETFELKRRRRARP